MMPPNSQDRPDVESIIANLKADQNALASPFSTEGVAPETDLNALLAEANRLCQPSTAPAWKHFMRKPIRFLFSDIFDANAAMVRCLNRITRLLSGEDLPEAGPLLEAQNRRITLLQSLNERVVALEAKINQGENAQ